MSTWKLCSASSLYLVCEKKPEIKRMEQLKELQRLALVNKITTGPFGIKISSGLKVSNARTPHSCTLKGKMLALLRYPSY